MLLKNKPGNQLAEMADSYKEYTFTVSPPYPGIEILIAELAELGFESFDESENGLKAYIQENIDSEKAVKALDILQSAEFEIDYSTKTIQQENWNARWESEFKPIEVGTKCRIRAPFHPEKKVDYEIVISPKMAFGTGHHATTYLMLRFILREEMQDKQVLDMGCGTGVLAILASMKKAAHIDAIDIDPWSYENTLENARLNRINNIAVFEGDSSLLGKKKYDFILANINRNVLLKDMETYSGCLIKG